MYTPPDPAKIAILKVHPKYKLMLRSLRTYGIIRRSIQLRRSTGPDRRNVYYYGLLGLGASFQFHR